MLKEPALQFPRRGGRVSFYPILSEVQGISWPSCIIKSSLLYVVMVSCLNYGPNSAEIDSDIRGRSADKKLGLSPWRELRAWSYQKNLRG